MCAWPGGVPPARTTAGGGVGAMWMFTEVLLMVGQCKPEGLPRLSSSDCLEALCCSQTSQRDHRGKFSSLWTGKELSSPPAQTLKEHEKCLGASGG